MPRGGLDSLVAGVLSLGTAAASSHMEAAVDDHVAQLFAGHIGVCAVLVNILIDKGIVSHEEAADRFRQAYAAAADCSGGTEVARAIVDDQLR